ncbi:hypothetical protein [Acinetobacter stercoris]|uniref:Uncharacterized protein n=1 Tax=Acinetobacter stercoris TaxID=2126983 RepID=A0A2U3MVG0_9GAMM|nr:hypothetical protein [Acinetobacter stercoris]SPL69427.1 hypothetical protein KPC_0605 [Acinetobacter stercoris]
MSNPLIRKLIMGIVFVTIVAGGYYFYQSSLKNSEEYNKRMFDIVMTEKMNLLYEQAKDWSKPLNFDVHDKRLHGDYQILSEFLLNYWAENTEIRNQYLRTLKENKWDEFLDVNRLEADKKQNYKESTEMLKNVRAAAESYKNRNGDNKRKALAQVQGLALRDDMKKALYEKLQSNLNVDKDSSLIADELLIMNQADEMLEMLKKYPWQVSDHQILFYTDAQVKRFNSIYQAILNQDAKIKEKTEQNAEAVKNED